MKKRTFTGIATAALITTAGISVTNNLKPENPLKTGEGTVQAATYQQEFLNKAIPAATTASSKYGTYTSVMLAQAAVESAWGQSGLAQAPNNNLFGIKGSYKGQSVNMNTGEYGSNGYYTTNAGFRKYPSYTESFEDNGSLLRNQMGNYYSGTWVENSNNYAQATQNGLQGKYATAPNYAKTLNSVIAANGFDKYDPVTQVVNENRTVAQTTPIMSAPVDASVGTQVGTARTGQNVNVTKYITYNNGVKRAYIGTGWINALAFSPITTNTTANNAATNKQVSQTVKTPVAQTQQAKSQAPAAPVKTATVTVKAKSAAEVKTPVQTNTLNVKTENKVAQPVKQLATSLAVAPAKKEVKKEVIKAEPAKTTPVKAASTKVETKQIKPANPVVNTSNKVVDTNWVKQEGTFTTGGAINLRTGASTNSSIIAQLPANSEVKYDAYSTKGNYTWLRQPRANNQYGYLVGRANGQDWGTFKVAPVANHVTKPTTNTAKPAQNVNKPSQPVHVNTNNNVNNNWTKQNGVFITGGAINLRTGASTNSKVIALLPTNTEIKYDAYRTTGQYTWLRQPRANGQYGYLVGRLNNQAWGTYR